MHRQLFFELPNDLRSIERTVDALVAEGHEVGFDARRLRLNLRVGVTEALANAMIYGNCRDPEKRVVVEAEIAAEACTVRVTDEGGGFNPEHVPDPRLPRYRERVGGRGIFLIRALMDHVEFNERGNSISMVLLGETGGGVREGAS